MTKSKTLREVRTSIENYIAHALMDAEDERNKGWTECDQKLVCKYMASALEYQEKLQEFVTFAEGYAEDWGAGEMTREEQKAWHENSKVRT